MGKTSNAPSWVRHGADFASVTEALYAEGSAMDWAGEALERFSRFFDTSAGVLLAVLEHDDELANPRLTLAHGIGPAGAGLAASAQGVVANAPPEALRAFFYPSSPVETHSEVERSLSPIVRGSSMAFRKQVGAADALRLCVSPEPGVAVTLYVPLTTVRLVERRERTHLVRLALHLENSARLQRRPEALLGVLDAEGNLVDDAPNAPSQRALARHVVHIELARSRAMRRSPASLELWRGLCEGRATLVERGHGKNRRYWVLGNAPHSFPTRRLDSREAEVLLHAARGLSNKQVGYALGVSDATVSAVLGRATHKLGLSSRAALVRLAARLGADPASRVDLGALTPAEHEVLDLVRRGLSNREIAQARSKAQRTIANQVASILGKTGADGRRGLVALG